MVESRIIKYGELLGVALIIEPILNYVGIKLPEQITRFLISFIISYIIIEELKSLKWRIDKYIFTKIKEYNKEKENAKEKKK